MGTVALSLKGGEKRYGRDASSTVFSGVDLALGQGELLALLGPSGCGKSTLIRCLAGLEAFSAGALAFVDGHQPKPGDVGVVFQEPLLMPWLTVRANVQLGLAFRRNREASRRALGVDDLLGVLGLAELADARPNELSGGQAQRVSVARAMVTHPGVLLLDEPFAALDPVTRASLQRWLSRVRRDLALSVVVVTHDVDEALSLGDRVALLSRRPASVIAQWDVAHADEASRARQRREILAGYERASPTETKAPTPAHPIVAARA